MSSNTENIEARLCAFLEGDLDEQGRAEIEKHLDTHPAHRALLEELNRTKVMLLSLPRESAPADLAETLQGHLERSVLLDGVGTDHLETTLKINRWPQLMSVAAVVLLALGLGVLVYVVLPQHSSAPVAMSTKDGLIPAAGVGEMAKLNDGSTNERLRNTVGDDKEIGKIGSKPTDILAATPGSNSADAAGAASSGLAMNEKNKAGTPFVEAVEDNGRRFGKSGASIQSKPAAKPDGTASPEAKRVYVVVSTDNLEATNGQLAGYLVANKIAWQPVNRGEFETQVPADMAFLSRANNQQFRLNVTGNYNNDYLAGNNAYASKKAGDSNTQQYSQNPIGNNSYKDKSAPAEPMPGNGGGGALANASNGLTQNGTNTEAQAKATFAQRSGSQSLQPAVVDNGVGQQPNVSAATAPAYNLAESKSESVIVARGLTRQQAVELGRSLDKLYVGQTTVVIDRDAVADTESGLTVGGKLDAKKRLEEKMEQIVPAKGPATTEPSTTQPADADQSIQTPAVVVVPTTLPAADDAQALENKSKGEFAEGAPLKTQPTTQPLAQQEFGGGQVAIQAKTTPPADESVDVVIVVQPPIALNVVNQTITTDPPNSAAPTTQPAETVQIAVPSPAPPTTQQTEPEMGK